MFVIMSKYIKIMSINTKSFESMSWHQEAHHYVKSMESICMSWHQNMSHSQSSCHNIRNYVMASKSMESMSWCQKYVMTSRSTSWCQRYGQFVMTSNKYVIKSKVITFKYRSLNIKKYVSPHLTKWFSFTFIFRHFYNLFCSRDIDDYVFFTFLVILTLIFNLYLWYFLKKQTSYQAITV